jgi:DNA-directed RNA polymerase specialized sigma24 family protein
MPKTDGHVATAETAELGSLELAYEAGKREWPRVRWPRAAYLAHVNAIRSPKSTHFADLYLSGAAGFDASNAWEVFDGEFSRRTKAFLKAQGMHAQDPDDVWGETRLRLATPTENLRSTALEQLGFASKPTRIAEFCGATRLFSYVLLIARRIAITSGKKADSESRILRVYIDGSPEQQDSPASGEPALDDTELRPRILAAAVEVLRSLPAEDRALFRMVYLQGMTRKEAAAVLSWPDASKATRHLQAIGQQLAAVVADVTGERHADLNTRDPVGLLNFFRTVMQSSGLAPSPLPSGDQRGSHKDLDTAEGETS